MKDKIKLKSNKIDKNKHFAHIAILNYKSKTIKSLKQFSRQSLKKDLKNIKQKDYEY